STELEQALAAAKLGFGPERVESADLFVAGGRYRVITVDLGLDRLRQPRIHLAACLAGKGAVGVRGEGRAILQIDGHRVEQYVRPRIQPGPQDRFKIAAKMAVNRFFGTIIRSELVLQEHLHAAPGWAGRWLAAQVPAGIHN